MWFYGQQALIFCPINFYYFTVWCLQSLCHLKRKLFQSTIKPVEMFISIVKDWYKWLVSGLVHLLSNDPLKRTGLMSYIHVQNNKHTIKDQWFEHSIIPNGTDLTAHNWQKWKRVFLTRPCHNIYRDEVGGLNSCKYTWKFTIFVKMWNLGQYRENLIFCQ